MSIRLMSWAFHDSPADLSPAQVLVLLALADAADDTGHVRFLPKDGRSQTELAVKTRMSRRTMQRALDVLVDRGLVVKSQATIFEAHEYRIVVRQNDAATVRQNDASVRHSDAPHVRQNDASSSIDGISNGNGDIDTNRYFDAAWKLWPRKTNKVAARKAFEKARKPFGIDLLNGEVTGATPLVGHDVLDHLQATVRRFGHAYTEAGTDPQFVPHLATWLNQQRWTDPIPTGQRQQRDTPRDDFGDGNEWMGMAR